MRHLHRLLPVRADRRRSGCRKVVRRAQLGFEEDVLPSDDLWLCTTCFTCYERCPRGVEIVDIIMALRNMAVRKGYMAEPHRKVAELISKTGHLVTLRDEDKALRSKLGLQGTPPTVFSDPKALEEVKKIAVLCGFDKLVDDRRQVTWLSTDSSWDASCRSGTQASRAPRGRS